MKTFSLRKRKKKAGSIDETLASEIVEIFEEKLDDLKITLHSDKKSILKQRNDVLYVLKHDLLYEIANFISINRKQFIKSKI